MLANHLLRNYLNGINLPQLGDTLPIDIHSQRVNDSGLENYIIPISWNPNFHQQNHLSNALLEKEKKNQYLKLV